jgi:tetratricopeptide (TPR) repeat protein
MNFLQVSYFLSGGRSILIALFFALALLSFAPQIFAQDDPDDTDEAVTIFNQGQAAHEKGDLLAAIKLYDKALEMVPEFPEAELQRGNAYLALGKIDDAEKSFRHATELREDWSLALASLGSVLVRKNQFLEAEKILDKAIELDELNFPAFTAIADLRLKTRAKPEVLKELLGKLKVLSSKASPTAAVWASKGSLENALGDTAAAKKSLDQALTIEPKNRPALFERAWIALSEADVTRADEIAKALAQSAPRSGDVEYLQANVLLAKDKPDDALKILESIASPSAEVSALRDKILANRSENPADLEAALAKDQKNAAILSRLCVVMRTKDPLKAIDYCRRASDADPANVNHAVGYGAALVQAKYFTQAVDLFRRILTVAPDNFTVHTNLATALSQLKRFPEAKTEYRWLIEKQPDLVIAYYLLGITHDQLGEYMDAAANYQQFLKMADAERNKLEIEKVNLRLPILQKLIKEKKGKN